MSGFLSPGFGDGVGDAQACFRQVLDAMARPGRVHTVTGVAAPPPPLCDAAAAVVLTLLDHETPLWLDPDAGAARDWIAFHTGAPVTGEVGRAVFALRLAMPHSCTAGEGVSRSVMAGEGPPSTPSPAMMGLRAGTDEAPETSATLILQVASLTSGRRYVLEGPGLREPAVLAVDGLPGDFVAVWHRNHALFPCGIDLILCAGNGLAALPRSVSVREG